MVGKSHRRNSKRKGTESKITIIGSPDINSVDGVNQYVHSSKKRPYNPPVGLVTVETDKKEPKKKYMYDPHLDPVLNFDSRKQRDELAEIIKRGLNSGTIEDAKEALRYLERAQEPYLNWAGKAEHTSFEVDTVSLHVHERVDPLTIMEKVIMKETGLVQMSLFPYFDNPENNPPIREAIHFYKHSQNWSNRLIAGDSLLVMNSLLQKESMAGKVQTIYIDPPYGVYYSSNFQPFVNKKDVREKDEDLTQEPEMVKAFRDTWELGIHSYLTYMRDRLLLARDLLHESGSCFVQISDENLHFVRSLMDEVFGRDNFVCIIDYRTRSMPLQTTLIDVSYDHLIWYAKDKTKIKFRKLFLEQDIEGDPNFKYVELPDGKRRALTKEEHNNHKLLPMGSRVYRLHYLKPTQYRKNQDFNFAFDGQVYAPPGGNVKNTPDGVHSWATTEEGMNRLAAARRLQVSGSTLQYVLFHDDYPVTALHTVWTDTAAVPNKEYVVQTSDEVIERCLLMTSDPGELVFDPTCGSGTTARAAEKYGRRWITCDTSRLICLFR